MEDWDPQKMLDLYIHDYLVRKNMHATAEIFSIEANFCPKEVAVAPPEGFLPEWFSLFWDIFSCRLPNDGDAIEGSSSKVIPIAQNVLQNSLPYMPLPDMNYVLQNVCPAMQNPGLPNFLNTVSPIIVPNPNINNFLQSLKIPGIEMNLNMFGAVPTPDLDVIPRIGMNLNMLGAVPTPDINMIQGTHITNSIAGGKHDHEHTRISAGNLTSNSLLHRPVESPCAPSSLEKSRQSKKKKGKNKRRVPVTKDDKSSASMDADSSPCAPKVMQIKAEVSDAGSSASSNPPRSVVAPESKII